MKTLLILRHAKSSWKEDNLSDRDRPLNTRGKRDAPRMGELLRREDLVPDLMISSTAKRARDTADLVTEASGYEGEVILTDEFYMAEPEDYVSVLSQVDDAYNRVMVVGHNPGQELLVEFLTGVDEHLPTAALAQVTLPIERWADMNDETEGELVNLWLPRSLPF